MRLAFVLAAGLAVGCTVTVERLGSPALLEEAVLPADHTRAEMVVTQLGLPDEIAATPEGLHLLYRFARRDVRHFLIGGYGFKLLSDERADHREGSLELWFDAAGRLSSSRLRHDANLAAEHDDE